MYSENSDGNIIDDFNGIIWSKDVHYHLSYATAICLQTDDWRLPTIKELMLILNHGRNTPSSDFPNLPPIRLWSSTISSHAKNEAWYVNFGIGEVACDYLSAKLSVILVRDNYVPF